jgi:hypothetical protein
MANQSQKPYPITLKWDLHTLHIYSKAQKMLGFLHRTSDPRFSIEAKRSLYPSIVRSNLGYASEVWSALSGKNLRMVEGIQRRATKFILGYHNPYQSYKDRLLALKLLPVCYWHEIKDLVFFFKIINGFYNVDISNLIQPNILLKSTRNSCSLDYVVPKCKTSQFQKSYFVRTVKLWNSLPTSTRCLSSVLVSELLFTIITSLRWILHLIVISQPRNLSVQNVSLHVI